MRVLSKEEKEESHKKVNDWWEHLDWNIKYKIYYLVELIDKKAEEKILISIGRIRNLK